MSHYSLVGQIHVASGLLAIVLGGSIVLLRKGTPIHRLTGITYVFMMLVLNLSALSIYDMTGRFGPFHVGAIFSLVCVCVGLTAAVRKNGGWLKRHYRWMGWSYFGLVAAAFAEAAVRVPALQAHTAKRGFEVAIGATLFFSLFGSRFMRLLSRDLNRAEIDVTSTAKSSG